MVRGYCSNKKTEYIILYILLTTSQATMAVCKYNNCDTLPTEELNGIDGVLCVRHKEAVVEIHRLYKNTPDEFEEYQLRVLLSYYLIPSLKDIGHIDYITNLEKKLKIQHPRRVCEYCKSISDIFSKIAFTERIDIQRYATILLPLNICQNCFEKIKICCNGIVRDGWCSYVVRYGNNTFTLHET